MRRVQDWILLLFVQHLLLLRQCVYGSSNVTVFEDRLTHDWSFWPKDSSTRESTGPAPVHSGKYALRVEFFTTTARLTLQAPAEDALVTTQYAGIEFWGFGGPTGALVEFLVDQDAMGHQPSKSIRFELKFGAWRRFYFTMNQLGNPYQISNLVWKSATGSPEHTHFYLDDIVVVGGGAPAPVPQPLSTVRPLPLQPAYNPSPKPLLPTPRPGSPCANGVQFTSYKGFAYNVDFLKYSDAKVVNECAMLCVTTHTCQSASFKRINNLCALYTSKTIPPQNLRRESSDPFYEEEPTDVEQSSDLWLRFKRNEGSFEWDGGQEWVYPAPPPSIGRGANEVSKFVEDSESVYIYGPRCQAGTVGPTQPQSPPSPHLSPLKSKEVFSALSQLNRSLLASAPALPERTCSTPVEYETVANGMYFGQSLGQFHVENEQACAEQCFKRPLCRSANFLVDGTCEVLIQDNTDVADDQTAFSNNMASSIYLHNLRCSSRSQSEDIIFYRAMKPFIDWLLAIFRQSPEQTQSSAAVSPVPPANTANQCGIPFVQPRMALTHSFEEMSGTRSSEEFLRIVGGTVAKPHSWPWQAALYYNTMFWCGGSLIHPQYILTAAHCVQKDRNPQRYKVMLGGHSKRANPNEGAVVIDVETVTIHPNYQKPISFAHDVAVLKLVRPVQLSNHINLVCLTKREFPPNSQCVVTGWGATQGTGNDAQLNQVTIPLIPFQTCNDAQHYFNRIDRSSICAGFEEGGRDACQGDSGGPLVCKHGDRWLQAGTVSWGKGCAKARQPGVYGNVAVMRSWILQQIR